MDMLNLSALDLLTTTRSVRQRLDLTRAVPTELIRQCIEIALQAPSGSNSQRWHFVVITDAVKKRAIADLYRQAWRAYAGAEAGAEDASRGGEGVEMKLTRAVPSRHNTSAPDYRFVGFAD